MVVGGVAGEVREGRREPRAKASSTWSSGPKAVPKSPVDDKADCTVTVKFVSLNCSSRPSRPSVSLSSYNDVKADGSRNRFRPEINDSHWLNEGK